MCIGEWYGGGVKGRKGGVVPSAKDSPAAASIICCLHCEVLVVQLLLVHRLAPKLLLLPLLVLLRLLP